MQNPYQQYKEQSLSTLTQGEILVRLFDESVKQLNLAKVHIGEKDYGAANEALNKVQAIVSTLASSLDMRISLSGELRELYIFLARHVLQANLKKDTAIIDECIPFFKDLRESFRQADKINRQAGAVGGQAV